MMGQNHVVDRIAISILVVGLVLASIGVGALGLATTTPPGETVETTEAVADDRTERLAFPIDNTTGRFGSSTTVLAFPINNATVSDGFLASVPATSTLGQDMDPYALPQDMDPY